MEYIIGRQGTQPCIITERSVSRRHLKVVSNDDGTFTIENMSPAGTYVDGASVVRTTVDADTVIRLGESFTTTMRELLSCASQSGATDVDDDSGLSEGVSIWQLQSVYDDYQRRKLEIQKRQSRMQANRMLPGMLLMLVSLGASIIGGGDVIRTVGAVITCISFVFVIYTIVAINRNASKTPEENLELDKYIRINYVCPKCGAFLGYTPYEALINQGKCASCKTAWREKT